MADLLGSLLPTSYMAPGVQAVLAGELSEHSTCLSRGYTPNCVNGTSPVDVCTPWGTAPMYSTCNPNGAP